MDGGTGPGYMDAFVSGACNGGDGIRDRLAGKGGKAGLDSGFLFFDEGTCFFFFHGRLAFLVVFCLLACLLDGIAMG